MKILDVEQGSHEWEQARIGIPTASAFDQIMTLKTRKPSASGPKYRNRLLAEWLVGHPIEWFAGNDWTIRGREMEAKARAWYEFERDVEVERVGFTLRDDEQTGASPDGLVGDDGMIEIKCPAIHTHIGYLIGDDPDYTHQVQGNLYINGRQWCDVVSYNPVLPKSVVRVERDDAFIADLETCLDAFIADLNAQKDRLAAYRSDHPDTLHAALTASLEAVA